MIVDFMVLYGTKKLEDDEEWYQTALPPRYYPVGSIISW